MALIYETENFILESHERPEIDRLEGGHMKINSKRDILDRTLLSPDEAKELMRFTIVAGQAMVSAMTKRGVKIGRINYQDNGNWNPKLHIHLYGRAVDANVQKSDNPFKPGHQEGFNKLNFEDVEEIRKEIEKLFTQEKYQDKNWKL